jgi:hypothetical protein
MAITSLGKQHQPLPLARAIVGGHRVGGGKGENEPQPAVNLTRFLGPVYFHVTVVFLKQI